MGPAVELAPPLLLVALPQVVDPFFHRSVVLLVAHDDEGSLGFIVNRPTEIGVGDILTGLELSWAGAEGARACFGGPVQPQLGTVLYSPDGRSLGATTSLVAPDLALTQHLDDLAALAGEPPNRFRLLLGYAGWGAGQLVEEILRNDWLVSTVDPAVVFAGEPEEAGTGALRAVGVDPDTLPSWCQEGGAAN